MSDLRDRLSDPVRYDRVIEACEALVEREVESKRGISGAAVKTGFKVVKKVRPGIIPSALRALVPDFCDALDPVWQSALSEGEPGATERFADALRRDTSSSAERLLGVTDARIADASTPVQKTYRGLRKSAKGHVEQALPALVSTLVPFVSESLER